MFNIKKWFVAVALTVIIPLSAYILLEAVAHRDESPLAPVQTRYKDIGWTLYSDSTLGFLFYYPKTVSLENLTNSLANKQLKMPYASALTFCSPPDLNVCRGYSGIFVETHGHTQNTYDYPAKPEILSSEKIRIGSVRAKILTVKNAWSNANDYWVQVTRGNTTLTLTSIKQGPYSSDKEAEAILFGFLHTFQWLK